MNNQDNRKPIEIVIEMFKAFFLGFATAAIIAIIYFLNNKFNYNLHIFRIGGKVNYKLCENQLLVDFKHDTFRYLQRQHFVYTLYLIYTKIDVSELTVKMI
mgnify:CR=1 FL=1